MLSRVAAPAWGAKALVGASTTNTQRCPWVRTCAPTIWIMSHPLNPHLCPSLDVLASPTWMASPPPGPLDLPPGPSMRIPASSLPPPGSCDSCSIYSLPAHAPERCFLSVLRASRQGSGVRARHLGLWPETVGWGGWGPELEICDAYRKTSRLAP